MISKICANVYCWSWTLQWGKTSPNFKLLQSDHARKHIYISEYDNISEGSNFFLRECTLSSTKHNICDKFYALKEHTFYIYQLTKKQMP